MELFITLVLPALVLVGLTLLFLTEGIPVWIEDLTRDSTTIWNFGIVFMSTISVIIYFAKR